MLVPAPSSVLMRSWGSACAGLARVSPTREAGPVTASSQKRMPRLGLCRASGQHHGQVQTPAQVLDCRRALTASLQGLSWQGWGTV